MQDLTRRQWRRWSSLGILAAGAFAQERGRGCTLSCALVIGLFPNLVLVAGIGLWVLAQRRQAD